MRYKLIAGVAQVPDTSVVLTPEEVKAGKKRPSKTLKVGDAYETDVDMVAKHGNEKWQLLGPNKVTKGSMPASLPSGTKPPQTKEEYLAMLDKMSTKELQTLADDQEVNLSGKKDRDSILKALKAEAESD